MPVFDSDLRTCRKVRSNIKYDRQSGSLHIGFGMMLLAMCALAAVSYVSGRKAGQTQNDTTSSSGQNSQQQLLEQASSNIAAISQRVEACEKQIAISRGHLEDAAKNGELSACGPGIKSEENLIARVTDLRKSMNEWLSYRYRLGTVSSR